MIDTKPTTNGHAPTTSRSPVEAIAKPRDLVGSRMLYSRLIGALFLLGFLFYGVGSGLATSLVGGSNFLSTIAASQTLLVIGAFLIFLNTGLDVGKAVLFFPIVERHSKRTALAYLATMIVEVLLLDIGALALLLIVPLAKHAGEAGAQTLGTILVQTNATAYQMGEMALGVGAVFLCLLLFRTQLIPRWLAVSGLIGYPILVAGTIAELFGAHIGLYLTIPGFFFELALPFWLFFKGFQPEAYQGLPINTVRS
jgi:Domain of unknown function (DUF4386)